MVNVRRVSLVLVACAVILGGIWVARSEAEPEAGLSYQVSSDEVQVASLIRELESMDQAELYALDPLKVQKFHVPPDSVDVMRARLSETYYVDGVGEDTVELAGWIAVKHFNARPVDGKSELTWNNAVVDTEFVGMDLKGESKLFGRVEVALDPDTPSRGQVGQIQIPELAKVALLADLETEEVAPEAAATESTEGNELELQPETINSAACVAPAVVAVNMPDLGLKMKTQRPVNWYSLVETIPPVGHVASIAIEPVRMVSEGREVATLKSGKVHFREIVRSTVLTDNQDVRIAGN